MPTETITETATKRVYGTPEYVLDEVTADMFGDAVEPEPDSVGWDLSFGSRITFSTDEEGPHVYLGLSDDAIANGCVRRLVTREQVLAFAEHLLRLVDAKPVLTLSEASVVADADISVTISVVDKAQEPLAEAQADTWNAFHAVGTVVDYWRGVREGFEPSGRGATRTPASVLSGHTAVVWIEGCTGCITLSHVRAVDLGSSVSNA